MAVTHHKSSTTIRGVTYNYGDTFICYASYSGATSSEGSGSALSLTVGETYTYSGYATDDSTGALTSYPYLVNNGRGWYKENVFPYATYTISYNANGGSGAPSSQKKTYGTALTLSSTKPTRTGYTFLGWSISSSATSESYNAGGSYTSNSNATLYAVWQINKYTLTINPNGGVWNGTASNSTATQNYGTTKTISNPTREGYTFNGWSLSNDNGSLSGTTYTYGAGNCTMTALWKANSYTYNIVYKSLSGIQLGTDTATYDYGTTNHIIPKAFDGYTNPDYQNVYWNQTAPKTITFTYTPTDYTITYTLDGGTVSTANKTSYNIETDTFTLNNPTKEGYTFSGWTGSNGNTPNKSVSIAKGSFGNKSYTANWTINQYSIVYKANGGVGSDQTQTVVYGTSWTTKDAIFSRVGYTIESWNTKADGSGTKYSLNTVQTNKQLSNVTLYAQWKESGVVYIDNGNKLEPYLVYIDNGTSWDLYLAYVDNGTSWDIIS